ncbi:MAG: apolipoprotein N-acyltransferase [Acidobacteria bacterium]|nr:apolipoprotein N-acyltransferase [Acidobacteriota bacterium]
MRRAAVALVSGGLLAAAFPPLDLSWAGWFLAAPLFVLAVTARTPLAAAREGFLFGLAFQAATFAWWYDLLVKWGRLSQPEAAGVYLLLAIHVALFFSLLGFWSHRIADRRGRPLALLVGPAIWAGLEWIRGFLFTGLPWSLLGATQARAPLFLQVADLGGVFAVSLVVAAGSAAAAAWWLRARRVAFVHLALIALAAAYGAARLALPGHVADRSIRVGLVQGNVAEEEKWDPSRAPAIFSAHLDATRRAAAAGAKLVVWPESAVPSPLVSSPAYLGALDLLAKDLGVDLLVGSVHYERRGAPDERTYNSAFLISGSGHPMQRYDKVHLVPYGEYVPLRRFLGFVEKLVVEASDFTPGARPRVLKGAGATLGPLVCFEAIFPSLARSVSLQGAELLVNLTNDAFLGDSAGPRQHLGLAVIRAVEERRYLVRAANTGISAVVDDRGRVLQSLAYGGAGILVTDVPLASGLSVYARVGDAVSWICVILSALAPFAPFPSGGRSWMKSYFDATPR